MLLYLLLYSFFFFYWSGDHRDLHSFPTRRSSDLTMLERGAQGHQALMVGHLTPYDPAFTQQLAATRAAVAVQHGPAAAALDRKSTRLNSSHSSISYAVFCLKKKKTS